jgi:5-methylcytosine-specific restriction protein A
MPVKPKRLCAQLGCSALVDSGYCGTHKRDTHTTSKQYQSLYNYRWYKARNLYIKQNALCVVCLTKGRVNTAQVVDHIKPHKGDVILFWDRKNWQSLCAECHNIKTAMEDGGFGVIKK